MYFLCMPLTVDIITGIYLVYLKPMPVSGRLFLVMWEKCNYNKTNTSVFLADKTSALACKQYNIIFFVSVSSRLNKFILRNVL